MKKFALLAASLIAFAGCSRNDTDDMTTAPARSGTGYGTPATTQSGSEMNSASPSSTATNFSAPSALDNTNRPSAANRGLDADSQSAEYTNNLSQPASQQPEQPASPPPQQSQPQSPDQNNPPNP